MSEMSVIKYNNSILIENSKKETWVYDFSSRKFLVSNNDINSVLNWLEENQPLIDDNTVIDNGYCEVMAQFNKNDKMTLIFNSSEVCNLKCKYCFANEGTYDNRSNKKFLSFDEYCEIYNEIGKSFPIKSIEFFGGEPVLNILEIMKFCEYLKNLYTSGYIAEIPQFGIITNGTLLDENIWEFFNLYNFHVTISLDGPESVNDANRIFKNETGTYKKIMEAIGKNNLSPIKFEGCEATLTCTQLNGMNDKEMIEYIDFWDRLPCKTVAIFFALDNNENIYSCDEFFKEQLKKFYEIYTKYCVDKLVSQQLKKNHSDIINAIYGFIFGGKISTCSAGINQLFINVFGDIYPCQRYYNISSPMCNYKERDELKRKIAARKHTLPKRINEECLKCEFIRVCEGTSCPGNNLAINGVEKEPVSLLCEVNKIRNEVILRNLFEIIKDERKKENLLEGINRLFEELGMAGGDENIFI